MTGTEQLDGRYWPARVAPDVGMTPRRAWVAWLAGDIDAAEFGRVVNAWTEAMA